MQNIFLNSIILSSLLFVGCSEDSDEKNPIPERNETEIVDTPEINETDIVDTPEVNETEIVDTPEINESVEVKTTVSIPLCDDENLALESGDKIQKVSENPEVEIQHLASGIKSICVKSGEAQIERISE
jgi:hypothetical protein